MSEVWFTSDLHLGHPKMAQSRGFSSIQEHDETIVATYNTLVSKRDSVYILGDVVWARTCLHYLAGLKGSKTIVLGNHDQRLGRKYLEFVSRVEGAATKQYDEMRTIMTHVPVHPCQFEHRFHLNIHGHLHAKRVPDLRYLNVGLEQNNLQPFHLDAIRGRLHNIKEEANARIESQENSASMLWWPELS